MPNISVSRARVPHSAGDFTPAGGGRCLPSVLNTWPMKPSGVQLARPILPPALQTRSSSAAARLLVRREHHAEGREHDVEAVVRERQVLGVGLAGIRSCSPSASARARRARAAPARSRSSVTSHQRRAAASVAIAVAGGDVEHLLSRIAGRAPRRAPRRRSAASRRRWRNCLTTTRPAVWSSARRDRAPRGRKIGSG